jgi:hypothetical protein
MATQLPTDPLVTFPLNMTTPRESIAHLVTLRQPAGSSRATEETPRVRFALKRFAHLLSDTSEGAR